MGERQDQVCLDYNKDNEWQVEIVLKDDREAAFAFEASSAPPAKRLSVDSNQRT